MKYNVEYLFPSLVHIIETDVDEQIKPYCLKARQEDPVGTVISNIKGWQSQGIYQDTLITDSLYKIFNKTIRNLFNSDLKIVNHWININGPNSSNAIHAHPECDLAGVYYIDVPENSGHIMFENPQNFVITNQLETFTNESREQHNQHLVKYIKPVKGLLLIFPAHLRHGVLPNDSNEDRISVSFNILLGKWLHLREVI